MPEVLNIAIKRFAQILAHGCGEMGVDLCGLNAGMPEEDLNRANINATLQQVGGKAVAQRVRLYRLV